jgi:hypothetical protein
MDHYRPVSHKSAIQVWGVDQAHGTDNKVEMVVWEDLHFCRVSAIVRDIRVLLRYNQKLWIGEK